MSEFENDDVLKALREELNSVQPSAEFAVKVRQRIAGELDLLREELAAVNPSPEFKVRVRQQIEADVEMRPARWLSGWRWLMPAGAAAAVVVAIIAISRPDQTPRVPVVASAPGAPVIQSPGVANVPPVSVTAQQRTPNVRVTPRVGPVEPLNASATAVRTEEPALEVITNQPALLRAMWAQMTADAPPTQTDAVPEPQTVGEIVVAPIEVGAIVVKLLIETPGGEVSPIIRKQTAELAERSAK